MLDGIRSNDIIVGAYTGPDGICPMLAAHRNGRPDRLHLVRQSLGSVRIERLPHPSRRARRATRRELLVLITQLEASLLDDEAPASDLAAAIAEHKTLVASRQPTRRSGPRSRAAHASRLGVDASDAPLRRVRACDGAARAPNAPDRRTRASRRERMTDIRAGRRRRRDIASRQGAVPGHHQARPRSLLRGHRRHHAPAGRRSAAELRALSGRHRRQQDLPAARLQALSGLGQARRDPQVRRHRAARRRQRRRDAGVSGQPGA